MSSLIWHATAPRALRRLNATAGPAGVVLGREHGGDLAPLRLFRAEPTRLVVVGGPWLAQLIVFRCVAVGAQVLVSTATPARWRDFAADAKVTSAVRVVGDSTPGPADHGLGPVLHLNDIGAGSPDRGPLAAWQCQVTVLPALTANAADGLAEANAVVLQRLSTDEARVAAAVLHLTPPAETRLHQMHDDLIALVIGGVPRFLWLAATPTEEDLLGSPRRHEA